MARLYFGFLVIAVFVGQIHAEDCYDYDEELNEAIKTCEDCNKEHADKPDVVKCVLEKEGLLDEDDNLQAHILVDYYVKDFKGDDMKKEGIKRGLEACLKDEPNTSAEFEKLEQCLDDVVIQFCPEAEEKIKEANENELLKTCY